MHGLAWYGDPIIDPVTGDTTVFPLYGDPVAGTGWYQGLGWPGYENEDGSDVNIMNTSGSFALVPGDSQEIEIAIIMARGDDYLDSVTKLKQKARAVREFYFTGEITSLEESELVIPSSFVLDQNYPNPFNPTTAIGYRLSAFSDVI